MALNINLGSGKLDVQIRPPRVRFDDNQWHRVIIQRKAQEVHFSNTFLSSSLFGIFASLAQISGPESLCHVSRRPLFIVKRFIHL